MDTKIRDLSGGEINCALLARAILTEPDIVLLDEPTNHLDTEGKIHFKKVIDSVTAPLMVISHDRDFLDSSTDQTFILAYGKIHSFNLPYSDAKVEFEKQREDLERLALEQTRRRQEILESTRRLQGFAKSSDRMAGLYRASLTKLERFEASMVEVPRVRRGKVLIGASEFRGQRIAQVYQYEVVNPGTNKCLYRIEDLSIGPGDKIAILGVNGAGKSTLLESMVHLYRAGEMSTAGKCI